MAEKIIKKLTSEFLESIGFTYDGVNWVNANYPFKLQKIDDAYQVSTYEGSLSNCRITDYAQLMQLILVVANQFITEGLKINSERYL